MYTHFPSKANSLAVSLKEICSCVTSARKEFHNIETQFSNRKEKPPFVWPFFLIMKKQNSWLCQIKTWAVLEFSFNKPTQIHLMFLYKGYCCIEKAFFLHHIHQCFSVRLLPPRLSPSWLHPKQGGQQARERILPLHSAPALGAPAQESHGPVRAGLGEHHKHNHRVGAPLQ